MATKRPWFAELEPAAPREIPGGSMLPERAQMLADVLGPGPAGWAVELGALMAANITAAIPELAVDAVADEVAKGCEAVALGALSALALDDQVSFAAMPGILAGPMEVVARGIGIEHMLRSIHLAHSTAVTVLLDAADRVVPEAQRFAEMRRINEALFGIVDVLTKRMADEYARAHEAWLTSSVALRAEIVEDLLSGSAVPMDRATRILGYDLSRRHLAVVVWTAATRPAEPIRLRTAASETLAASGCTSTLVLPVGAQRVWAWGSRTAGPPEQVAPAAPPAPGVRIAIGTAGAGVEGFRHSHRQAAEAARVGALSTRDAWSFCYQDLDVVAMLSTDLPAAREFVSRELGELVGNTEAVTAVRHTLKRYLDFDRSLAGTAADLHVARNTVAYRVQRAEQLRGRPASVRRLQLHAALVLAEELGDAVLRPQLD
ncbi:PucR family transcriptional regulator [Mycolicibacterium hippocampi]|uniref:PucR family transcriptional regulator n=1 Tax=Mycolicibacterium hippocampi TaxID=659824 RepID=UPI00351222AF